MVHIEDCGWNNHLRMDINLEAICNTENQYYSEDVPGGINYKHRGVKTYPMNKVKKIFRLIKIYSDPQQIEDVYEYLKDHSEKYATLFADTNKRR